MDLFSRRTAGLLLHPTSLPGPHGAGDLGDEAHRFLDFLATARLTSWQMLPVGPPGRSSSPYDATSAFAGSPALISLRELVAVGLLRDEEIPAFPARQHRGQGSERVDLRRVFEFRRARLRKAFERASGQRRWQRDLERFRAEEVAWLEDHALFAALREVHGSRSWTRWDEPLRKRQKSALRGARERHAERIAFHAFLQLLFARQWGELRRRARVAGIRLIGDVPIYVALESADVWSHPQLFDLRDDGRPRTVAGVPPDYFNRNGQLWGNPTYRWERHAAEGYAWWVARLERTLDLFDDLRLDHFIGFHRGWTVSAGARTARRGRWRPGPGAALFQALRARRGPVRLIAEDLGLVTPEVLRLRDESGFRGMRLLQFAFDGNPANPNLPHNLPRDCVVYTGTHDNKTTRQWFEQDVPDSERRRRKEMRAARECALAYLGSDGRAFHHDLVRAAFASVADTVVIPVQDVLGLGGEARMNRPGTARDNWNWRLTAGALRAEDAARLAEWSRRYGRDERPA